MNTEFSIGSTVVVDIGATKIMAACASNSIEGETVTIPTPSRSQEEFVFHLVDLIRRVHPSPTRIVVATPGAVDTLSDRHIDPANLGFSRIPLRDLLMAHFTVPIDLIGDAEAGAIAEFAAGAAATAHVNDGIYLTVSTGIGAGLVLDGRLRVHNGVGEIGHTPVFCATNAICGCGATGCLETVASGTGVAAQANALASRSRYLSSIATDRPLTARDVCHAAEDGDPIASEIHTNCVSALAKVVAVLVRTLALEAVVIGGGFGVGAELCEPIEEAVRNLTRASQLPIDTLFLEAGFGRRSVLVGAALVAGHPDFRSEEDPRPSILAQSPWGIALLGKDAA